MERKKEYKMFVCVKRVRTLSSGELVGAPIISEFADESSTKMSSCIKNGGEDKKQRYVA